MKICDFESVNRMSAHYVVTGMTFEALMIKIKHMDRSWA